MIETDELAALAATLHARVQVMTAKIVETENALVKAGACVRVLPNEYNYLDKLFFAKYYKNWRICVRDKAVEDGLKPWTGASMAEKVESFSGLNGLLLNIRNEMQRLVDRSK